MSATHHDDEILGKAYDAVLMRRLLTYLRPYWRSVLVAFVGIVVGTGAALAQPYLIKIAIDEHIAPVRSLEQPHHDRDVERAPALRPRHEPRHRKRG